MALNGITRRSSDPWHGNKPMHDSFDIWVDKNGKDAFKDFKKDHPTTKHSYDSWRQTEQVYGPYLFYITSMIWHEDGDSDDGSTKRRRISRGPDGNPKKTATTNGNGAPRTATPATPAPAANSDEINASGKRKRKPRKKYMSQELVASDEEPTDEIEAPLPIAEEETSSVPHIAVNGRRKSASRKPRKKPISDETISPEDENDDPMEIDSHPIASPLPVRPASRAAAVTRQSTSPKKATPKQASVKKLRKSFLSEEMVIDEDTDHGGASIAEVSRPARTPATKSKSDTSSDVRSDNHAQEAVEPEEEGTPDPSAASTRRGLRNRKPAQQRPYYHDAQVFEDVETDEEEDDSELEAVSREESLEAPPQTKPKHFKGKGRAWKKDGSDEDEEFVTPKEKKAAQAAKAKADREKAKAEKEKAPEEDGDITVALWDILLSAAQHRAELDEQIEQNEQNEQDNSLAKRAADDAMKHAFWNALNIPVKKDTLKQKKKSGRPKKNLSEGTIRDESDNDTPQATPSQPPKRGRGRPRKSALSAEIVRDDSDDETPAATKQLSPSVQRAVSLTTDLTTPPKTKTTSRPSTAKSTVEATTPKKRGRPRKSLTVTTPAKSSSKPNKPADDYKPQRRGSTATDAEPTTAEVPANISSAPEEYPMPNLNRGAALIESLYPRDQRETSRASSASTPAAPMAPSMLPASVPAEDKPEPSASDAQSGEMQQEEPVMVLDTTPEPAPAPAPVSVDVDASVPAPPEPASDLASVPEPKPEPKPMPLPELELEPTPLSEPALVPVAAEVKTESSAEPQVEGEDEGNMSAAMSLSSDSEL